MIQNIVFFIQNFSRPAGSERVTSIIANNLVKQGYNVSILSVCGDNSSFYDIDSRINLFTLINKPEINNKTSFFKVRKGLIKFYSTHKVDLVIDVFAPLSIYTLLLKKKFHYKNITWEHFNYKQNVGLNKYGRKLAVKKSDYIVTLTARDEEYYKAANPNMKSLITHIVNPNPFENSVGLGLPRENLVISVGRLTYQKGFDTMLQVWKKVEKTHPDWKLNIIGSGEERENLLALIKKLDLQSVELIEANNLIGRYYERSKIYLSTARFEGLPMTMIEAQSFGLPIVSFDYDTGPSEIITDGEDGVLVENQNIDEISKQLSSLMEDEERINNYSQQALKNSKRFDSNNIVSRWIEVIGKIE